MRLAPEGRWQMILSTVVLGSGAWAVGHWSIPAVVPLLMVWVWSVAFFRDPKREANFGPGVMCAPADGTVRDITHLESYGPIGGPAIRVGIFLSLFNVHINRSPCSGTVESVVYRKGRFLAAMNPAAGEMNESNTMVIDAVDPLPGPVVVRQIAGVAARRIVCHASAGATLSTGERFGLIKFGSRTELIVPACEGTEVLVSVGDKVRAGLTPLIRQRRAMRQGYEGGLDNQDREPVTAASA